MELKMKRMLVGTIIGMASEIFSVDGVEQVIGNPELFHVDAIPEHKVLGITIPRKYLIDEITVLLRVPDGDSIYPVPVMFNVKHKKATVATDFMYLHGNAMKTFLKEKGMKITRVISF